ncbi:hypothetical protein H0H92_014774, partial [Tricholoma furcatifolium]
NKGDSGERGDDGGGETTFSGTPVVNEGAVKEEGVDAERTFNDEEGTPVVEEGVPNKEGKGTTPVNEGEGTTPVDEGEGTTPVDEGEGTTPVDDNDEGVREGPTRTNDGEEAANKEGVDDDEEEGSAVVREAELVWRAVAKAISASGAGAPACCD